MTSERKKVMVGMVATSFPYLSSLGNPLHLYFLRGSLKNEGMSKHSELETFSSYCTGSYTPPPIYVKHSKSQVYLLGFAEKGRVFSKSYKVN